jgi:LPS export ABC transporter permease LptG/LPS export ABC transporter permease LptF
MLKTIDRYIIREILPPFGLAVLIFTFLLQLSPLMEELERLVAKGVPWSTVGHMIVLLAPQALGLTIPMGLLVGILIGLGRLSSDREGVALLACGVSPYRLLRPIMLLSVLSTAATLYVMVWAIPQNNQKYREILYDIIAKKAESDVRARVFFEEFPPWVLFPRDEAPAGQHGWKDLLVANTAQPGLPEIHFAERGRLVLNREARQVALILSNGTRYRSPKPRETETYEFPGELILALDPNSIFPPMNLPPGVNEKTVAELRQTIADKEKNKISPHPEIMAIHAKFSIPTACLVFGVIGLALGLSVARDTKFAGFVVGIAVIFAYYTIMFVSESAAKGQQIPAWPARWIPNVVLGPIGIVALIWRARYTEGRLPFRIPFRLPALPAWIRRAADVQVAGAPANASSRYPHLRASRYGGQAGLPGSRARRPGTVVVVRIPRVRVPGPGLIDRYISRIYLRVVGLSFLGLLGIFYIATFIDKSDKMFKGQAGVGSVMTLLVYMTPQFVYFIIPIAALLSVLVTFGLLSRSSELTVMKACGISLYRAAASVVLLGALFSVAMFGLDQRLLAHANRQAEILDSQIRGRPPRTYSALNRRWVIGRDGAIYHYGFYDPVAGELGHLSIYETRKDRWALASHTFMKRAVFRGGVWQGEGGWHVDYKAAPPRWTSLPSRPLPNLEPPDYFATEQPLAEMMTVPQLRAFIDELATSGLNHVPWAVELQRKFAFPFVTVVMTLLAVPFGVSTGRRGTLYGIGLAIVLALSYRIVSSAFIAIGIAGVLPPFLAAWAPNILTAGIAGYLLLRTRT